MSRCVRDFTLSIWQQRWWRELMAQAASNNAYVVGKTIRRGFCTERTCIYLNSGPYVRHSSYAHALCPSSPGAVLQVSDCSATFGLSWQNKASWPCRRWVTGTGKTVMASIRTPTEHKRTGTILRRRILGVGRERGGEQTNKWWASFSRTLINENTLLLGKNVGQNKRGKRLHTAAGC